MIDIGKEVNAFASWPTQERLLALKRIIPRARVEEVLAHTGQDRSFCSRLPGWFMVWFVIALGLFCCDCYRQVFRWLQPFRRGGNPGRSTFCEAPNVSASPHCGSWPIRSSVSKVSQLRLAHSTVACGPWLWTDSSSMCPIPRPTTVRSVAPAAAVPQPHSPRPASWPFARPAVMCCGAS